MNYLVNFSLLKRNRRFSLLFFGRSISLIGTMITSVALPFQTYHLTRSTLMVGLLSLAQLLPLLFTALYGGTLADKYQRRRILITAEIFLSIGCLLLAWNASLLHAHIAILFIIAALMSSINGLHRPSFDSLRQQLLDKKDYASAGALYTLMRNACMVIGPAIGGISISRFGLPFTYLVDFMTFGASLISLSLIGYVPKPILTMPQKTFAALKEGLFYAAQRQDLLGSYIVDFTAMVFGMPMALFPAIAMHFGGVTTLGLLYSAIAFGAVIMSIFSGWMVNIKRHCAAIAISASLWGLAIILFGLANDLGSALFFLALAGAFDGASGIFRSMLWNSTIPHELRGRLAGIEMISYLSGPKLGDTEAGFVASFFGIGTSIISGGILCIIGVAVICIVLPEFWGHQTKNELSNLS